MYTPWEEKKKRKIENLNARSCEAAPTPYWNNDHACRLLFAKLIGILYFKKECRMLKKMKFQVELQVAPKLLLML